MTNLERIKQMNAEKMAEFLNDVSITMTLCCDCCIKHHNCIEGEDCDENVKAWLEQEVQE